MSQRLASPPTGKHNQINLATHDTTADATLHVVLLYKQLQFRRYLTTVKLRYACPTRTLYLALTSTCSSKASYPAHCTWKTHTQ